MNDIKKPLTEAEVKAIVIALITTGKTTIAADYATLFAAFDGNRKEITTYLTAIGYRATDILEVTKELARTRSTAFYPQFVLDVISGEIGSVAEVEPYIKASLDKGIASANVLNKKAYFEREVKTSLDARANERLKVYAELGLDSNGNAIVTK